MSQQNLLRPLISFLLLLTATVSIALVLRHRAKTKMASSTPAPIIAWLSWIQLSAWLLWLVALPPSRIVALLPRLPSHNGYLDMLVGALVFSLPPLLAGAISLAILRMGANPNSNRTPDLLLFLLSEVPQALLAGFLLMGMALFFRDWRASIVGSAIGLVSFAAIKWLVEQLDQRRLTFFDAVEFRRRAMVLAQQAGVRLRGVNVFRHRHFHGTTAMAFPLRLQIAVSDRLIQNSTKREADAIVAHELAHFRAFPLTIRSGLNWAYLYVYLALWYALGETTILYGLEPFIALPALAAVILIARASQNREFAADARSAEVTRDPHGMIAALARMDNLDQEPAAWGRFEGLILSHPSVRRRALSLAARFQFPASRALAIVANPDELESGTAAAASRYALGAQSTYGERRIAAAASRLAARARKATNRPKTERLLVRACKKCRTLSEMNPHHPLGLTTWGNALFSNAQRNSLSEANRLLAEAGEKYSSALAIAPGDPELMAALAYTFLRRAETDRGDQANDLLVRTCELCEGAFRIMPASGYARVIWSRALCEQAKRAPGEEMDRTLAEARQYFEAAAAAQGNKPEILRGMALILFAQGMRASGEESVGLLRQAKENFIGSESREPGTGAYRAACVCARLGEHAECRHCLEYSREPGALVTRDELAAEPHFESVRNTEWFQRLVSSARLQ